MADILNDEQRLNLQKMISVNNAEDYTEHIRKTKQSNLIRTDVNHLLFLKTKYKRLAETNKDEFVRICTGQCKFLFNNYTDIFNKLIKNYLEPKILFSFLDVLKEIEDGKLDQHEGSYKVGELLKKIYIDSAMRKSYDMDNKHKDSAVKIVKPKKISYKEYKIMMNKE